MHCENRYDGIDPLAIWMVRRKARYLSRRAGFTPGDRKDIEQELMLHLATRLPQFNPDRGGFGTFVSCVIEHKAATLIEANIAPTHDRRRCACSLDAQLSSGDGTLSDFLPASDQQRRPPWGCQPDSSEEQQRALQMDLTRVFKLLTPKQRVICQALMDGRPTDVIRELKIPRIALYKEIKKLREIFAREGLRDYQ